MLRRYSAVSVVPWTARTSSRNGTYRSALAASANQDDLLLRFQLDVEGRTDVIGDVESKNSESHPSGQHFSPLIGVTPLLAGDRKASSVRVVTSH